MKKPPSSSSTAAAATAAAIPTQNPAPLPFAGGTGGTGAAAAQPTDGIGGPGGAGMPAAAAGNTIVGRSTAGTSTGGGAPAWGPSITTGAGLAVWLLLWSIDVPLGGRRMASRRRRKERVRARPSTSARHDLSA